MMRENYNEETNQEANSITVEAKAFTPPSRWQQILANKDIHKGVIAMARTAINVGITMADAVPIVGDAASWGADALKSDAAQNFFKKNKLPNFDLTPSVSKRIAWGTEILEIVTFGLMPSHVIETVIQFKREDLGHIKKAVSALKGITEAEHVGSKSLLGIK